MHRVLVVEDDGVSRKGLSDLMRAWGFEVESAASAEDAIDLVATWTPTVVISDVVMPGLDGLGLLAALTRDCPSAVVILLTAHATIETAVRAMKEGALDYLTKPVDPARLRILLDKAVERSETVQEMDRLRRQLRQRGALGRLAGTSPAIREVMRQLEVAAPTDATILVVGESGTGKELVARTAHELSARKRNPFVAINCAAIPETLLESEIFGHEKGAFTGAAERRQGCFELADGGTLFLDEIAEMQPTVQAKFLRVLQEGQFRRLGGKAELRVNVRVVAATNKDPLRAVRDGALREDLYYRLNVFALTLPPLSQRLDDLADLVNVFLEEFNERYGRAIRGVAEGAMAALRRHRWPGNVRELRNVIERAVVVCGNDLIDLEHLPGALTHAPSPATAAGEASVVIPIGTTVDEAERQLILSTLAHAGNNKTRAAEVLGISLKTLHNKLGRYQG